MIALGSDHGGLTLKTAIAELLSKMNIPVLDCGTDSANSVDYPDFAMKVARGVSTGRVEKGILFCGTGIGMSIVANKFHGVRAALATDVFMARMAKEHNNANILVLGGRVLDNEKACEMVSAWLEAVFEGGRHQARLDKIIELEKELCKEC